MKEKPKCNIYVQAQLKCKKGYTVLVSSCLSGNSCFCSSFVCVCVCVKKIERICMWNVVDIEKIMQTVPTELGTCEFKENCL